MKMETVIKVNGVVCAKDGNFIQMYGRKKQFYPKSGKVVENHILSGKFKSWKVK